MVIRPSHVSRSETSAILLHHYHSAPLAFLVLIDHPSGHSKAPMLFFRFCSLCSCQYSCSCATYLALLTDVVMSSILSCVELENFSIFAAPLSRCPVCFSGPCVESPNGYSKAAMLFFRFCALCSCQCSSSGATNLMILTIVRVGLLAFTDFLPLSCASKKHLMHVDSVFRAKALFGVCLLKVDCQASPNHSLHNCTAISPTFCAYIQTYST